MIRFLALLVVGAAIFVAFGTTPAPDKRILFIGNSFTFGGNVPVQVKNIASSARPSVNYHVEMVVRGGTTLAEHLAETPALSTIQQGEWDVVVLQGASSMSFDPVWAGEMQEAADVLASAAQDQGAEVFYFAHWSPSFANWTPRIEVAGRAQAVQLIQDTYTGIAEQTGGRVALVGQLWQAVEDDGVTGLNSADGHHASVKGAYVAALAIAEALGDVDIATVTWAPDEVAAGEADRLRAFAARLR